mmetsp:Transcript_48570/g.136495  ORF Transcript_48570/g.136495 Transcript_48570/m.136495 type:complete len:107 (+) Transcript_48570:1303-1623(+)
MAPSATTTITTTMVLGKMNDLAGRRTIMLDLAAVAIYLPTGHKMTSESNDSCAAIPILATTECNTVVSSPTPTRPPRARRVQHVCQSWVTRAPQLTWGASVHLSYI